MEKRYEIWVAGNLSGDFTAEEIRTNHLAGTWPGLVEIYYEGKYRPLEEAFSDLLSSGSRTDTPSLVGAAVRHEIEVSFECSSCDTALRIQVADGEIVVCPECATRFRTLRAKSDGVVFLVLREATQPGSSTEQITE